jgi:hypothetical protein
MKLVTFGRHDARGNNVFVADRVEIVFLLFVFAGTAGNWLAFLGGSAVSHDVPYLQMRCGFTQNVEQGAVCTAPEHPLYRRLAECEGESNHILFCYG